MRSRTIAAALAVGAVMAVPQPGRGFASEHMKISPCPGVASYKDCALIEISGPIVARGGPEFITRTKES